MGNLRVYSSRFVREDKKEGEEFDTLLKYVES